jgi:tetratricopeptide (TPR) repeat protein
MEWLEGHDLGAELAKGPLDVDRAVKLARRIGEALAAAHDRGIVHRDLKPANVFLVDGSVEKAKLIDFGIARPEQSDLLTASGVIVGTPAYMAPEQVRGETLDPRVDIYGLGTVLFHCLIGRAPFRGPHDIAVLAKVVLEEPPRLRTLRPEIPDALDALVRRMLAKSRDERPGDGRAVCEALGDLALDAAPKSEIEAIHSGEKRVATIVLCASGARREADTVVARKAGARRSSEDLVTSFGGTLHALSRDAVLVTLRGAASPNEQAVRAVRCALAIAAENPLAPIVVSTGRVVVAGDVQVGDVIDRATAVVLRGAPGVKIDAATSDLLEEGRFDVRGEGDWRELHAEREELASRTFLGRATPCVGRTRELAQLSASIDECFDEARAQVAIVTAPPGLGKSRLLHEVLRTRVASRGEVEVLFARGDSMRAGSSFGIVSQIIGRAENLSPMLRELAGEDLTNPELAASPAARGDVATMADTMRDEFVSWVRTRTEGGPVAIVVEDLHWADLPSLRLIDAALGALGTSPLLVLATARPEVHAKFPELFKQRVYQEVRLTNLPAKAAQSFVREMLGKETSDTIVETIVARAAGHPFYLEELVRAVTRGKRPDALPESVLGMIQSRLDDIGTGARRVLCAASVYGDSFWPSAVSTLLGSEDEDEIAAQLKRLVELEIVQPRTSSRMRGQAEYGFRHILLRDAAYETLTDEARSIAHHRAGSWLERAGENDPAVLADHYDRGAAKDRALGYYLHAARRALEASDFERARQHADRALACGPDEETRAAIGVVEAEVSYWRGELDSAIERASSSIDGVEPSSPEWFVAAATAIGALGQRGRNDEVRTWLRRVATAEPHDDARAQQAVALCRGLTQLMWAHDDGDLAAVHVRFDALVDEPALDDFTSGWVHRVRAESAWIHERNVDLCMTHFARSKGAFESARAVRHLCMTRANEASLAGWAGDIDRALSLVAECQGEATRLGSTFLACYATAVRGMTLVFAGDERGEAVMREALTSLAGSPRLAFICRFFAGWAALGRGDLDLAERDAQAAIATPVVRELQPAGHALLARVLTKRGRLDDALAEATKGMKLRRLRRDLELTEGVPDLALAEVHAARGDTNAMQSVLAEALPRVDAIAATIASPQLRSRFLARRVAIDELRRMAGREASA